VLLQQASMGTGHGRPAAHLQDQRDQRLRTRLRLRLRRDRVAAAHHGAHRLCPQAAAPLATQLLALLPVHAAKHDPDDAVLAGVLHGTLHHHLTWRAQLASGACGLDLDAQELQQAGGGNSSQHGCP
jgi:hypothetical protein